MRHPLMAQNTNIRFSQTQNFPQTHFLFLFYLARLFTSLGLWFNGTLWTGIGINKRGFENILWLVTTLLWPAMLTAFMPTLAWCTFSSCLTALANSSTSSSSWPVLLPSRVLSDYFTNNFDSKVSKHFFWVWVSNGLITNTWISI